MATVVRGTANRHWPAPKAREKPRDTRCFGGLHFQAVFLGAMSDDAAPPVPNSTPTLTLEEKILQYVPWDDSQWHPDWMKVYRNSIGVAAGGAVFGGLHALSTGRAVLLNSMVWAGYSTILAGIYFGSREALFGREIERFRQEALALGLTESSASNYPWRWDFASGTISGAFLSSIITRRRSLWAAGTVGFGLAAVSLRAGSAAFSDYIVPHLLPVERAKLERARKRSVMSEEDINRLEEAEKKAKPWIADYIPGWSPVKVYSQDERSRQKEDKEYEKWMEEEVQALRTSVGLRRRVKELEEERDAQLNSQFSQPSSSADPTPNSVMKVKSGPSL